MSNEQHWFKKVGEDGEVINLSFPFLKHVMSLDWREHTACSSLPKEVFFDYNSNNLTLVNKREYKELALSTCASCPVRSECYEFSICNNEPYGIWAGLTPDQRKPLVKKFKTTGILETLPA